MRSHTYILVNVLFGATQTLPIASEGVSRLLESFEKKRGCHRLYSDERSFSETVLTPQHCAPESVVRLKRIIYPGSPSRLRP